MNPLEFEYLNRLVQRQFGIAFNAVRVEMLTRRLQPRLDELGLTSFLDYYHRVCHDNGTELQELARLVTNNETYFFREAHQFTALLDHGVAHLVSPNTTPQRPLRILCAGVSSGEEAYTLNFLLRDHPTVWGGHQPEIDAFDLDRERVGMANRGIYRTRSLREMDETQIARYLDRVECRAGEYTVKPMYRAGVRFTAANIMESATYRQPELYDVVFCRNVLIYFSPTAIVAAAEGFASVLRPGGLLFLGHAETLRGRETAFDPIQLGPAFAYERRPR